VKEKQRSELLKQVDIVIAQNGGRPFTNELFREAQVCVHISERKDSENEAHFLILFYFCRKVQGGTRISISTQVDIRTNKCRF